MVFLLEALNFFDMPVMAGMVDTLPIAIGWRSAALVICIDEGRSSGARSLMMGMSDAIFQASLVSTCMRISLSAVVIMLEKEGGTRPILLFNAFDGINAAIPTKYRLVPNSDL